MNIPPIKSVKDLLLWPINFFISLHIGWQAIVLLCLAAIPILITLLASNGKPAEYAITLDKNVLMKVGSLEGNIDSTRVCKGAELIVMAECGHNVWVQTADGNTRGYVSRDVLRNSIDSLNLPQRRMQMSHYISKEAFNALMTDTATTLSSLQSNYLNADYIHSDGKNKVSEFSFIVVDSLGNRTRPMITFDASGHIKDYELFYGNIRRPQFAFSGKAIDLISPLISIKEFASYTPYDNVVTNLLWSYMPAFIPICLLMLLLWSRFPLIWMPNWLASLMVYVTWFYGCGIWVAVIFNAGVSVWPVGVVMLIIAVIGCFFLWLFYSRCPKCKRILNYELIQVLKGNPITNRGRFISKENERVVHVSTSNHRREITRVEKVGYGDTAKTVKYYSDMYTQITTYEYDKYYVNFEEIYCIKTKVFGCPKCNHKTYSDEKERISYKKWGHEYAGVGRRTEEKEVAK